jgi:uncharacterized protein
MNNILRELEQTIQKMFQSENSGHDIHHLKRVMALAVHLQKSEGGDKLVIAVAAYLHDVHRLIQQETGKYCSPQDSLPKVIEIMNKTDIPQHKRENILHCIEFHEEYNFSKQGKSVDDIETLILQDADNLDAIGAIGIARTFMYGGAYKVPMWVPEDPFDQESYDESASADPSAIHHFYSKLLKLKGNMNTTTAKKMADKRHKFMEYFLEEFFSEWKGVR